MKSALKRFLKKPSTDFESPSPEAPFVVIGDIHGRIDLLERLLHRLPDLPIICVGDYVDRGEHSAQVLRLLHDRNDIVCLSGNHEDMLLRFIDAPERHGGQWLLHGGLQTLSSFGVGGISPSSRAEEFIRLRDAFVSAVGADLINWLRDMPTIWRSGNIAVTHAGADPTKSIDVQKPQILRWGHPEFLKTSRTDGIWIIHGHTVVDAPEVVNGRVAIDTGAYSTGVLTATVAEANKFSFLSAQ